MIRRCLALALAIAVPAMLVEMPALHAHLDDHVTEHHHSRTIHSHFEEHHSTAPQHGPALQADDHDAALSLTAVAAVTAASFSPVALAVAIAQVAAPVSHRVTRPFEVSHGHDPPCGDVLSSRAPPAFLS